MPVGAARSPAPGVPVVPRAVPAAGVVARVRVVVRARTAPRTPVAPFPRVVPAVAAGRRNGGEVTRRRARRPAAIAGAPVAAGRPRQPTGENEARAIPRWAGMTVPAEAGSPAAVRAESPEAVTVDAAARARGAIGAPRGRGGRSAGAASLAAAPDG